MLDEMRLERGRELYQSGAVVKVEGKGRFAVGSSAADGTVYQVATPWAGRAWCTCPDFQRRGGVCKHQYAACLAEARERIEAKLQAGQSLHSIIGRLLLATIDDDDQELQQVAMLEMADVLRAEKVTA